MDYLRKYYLTPRACRGILQRAQKRGRELPPALEAAADSHASGGGQLAVAFKPSHYTRGKDEAPSEIMPPLSADADKGDQEAVIAVVPVSNDALRGEGSALTPSSDAEGRVRLRDPGLGVGKLGEPSYTIPAAGPPAVIPVTDPMPNAMRPRRLTPRECERLQALPDDWTAVGGMADGPRYRMLGDAVTRVVAEWLGHRIAIFHRPTDQSRP